jgi:tetratricopeptide (TPR) repeat protein
MSNFLYFATSDDTGGALTDDLALESVLKNSAPQGLRWVYHAYPTESHGGIALVAQIDALRQLFAGYAVPDAVLQQGLAAVNQYYAELSKKLGWDLHTPPIVVGNLAYNAIQAGMTEPALQLYRLNVKNNPNSPYVYDQLSWAYSHIGRIREALAEATRARDLAKKFHTPNQQYFERAVERQKSKLKE